MSILKWVVIISGICTAYGVLDLSICMLGWDCGEGGGWFTLGLIGYGGIVFVPAGFLYFIAWMGSRKEKKRK